MDIGYWLSSSQILLSGNVSLPGLLKQGMSERTVVSQEGGVNLQA